jgi:predicted RNA-binding Zn ribbon-like protein
MADPTRSIDNLEILGSAWCLDFVNTVNSRADPEDDYLVEYTDLVDWAVRAGLLPAARASWLYSQARRDPVPAENALQKALQLRELLYQIFSKVARQMDPAPGEMHGFVNAYAQAISLGALVRDRDHFDIDWADEPGFDGLLWPVIYSAGQILLSAELRQVKECPNCGWLFLDRSKNQSRRWCSMNTCGARDKMRRYQDKLRGHGT